MKILSINNSNNQIAHKAVNQKLFKQARDEFMRFAPHHNQIPLIDDIARSVYYGLLSYKDAIDTLEAIKPYSKNILEKIEKLISDLKSTP